MSCDDTGFFVDTLWFLMLCSVVGFFGAGELQCRKFLCGDIVVFEALSGCSADPDGESISSNEWCGICIVTGITVIRGSRGFMVSVFDCVQLGEDFPLLVKMHFTYQLLLDM